MVFDLLTVGGSEVNPSQLVGPVFRTSEPESAPNMEVQFTVRRC